MIPNNVPFHAAMSRSVASDTPRKAQEFSLASILLVYFEARAGKGPMVDKLNPRDNLQNRLKRLGREVRRLRALIDKAQEQTSQRRSLWSRMSGEPESISAADDRRRSPK